MPEEGAPAVAGDRAGPAPQRAARSERVEALVAGCPLRGQAVGHHVHVGGLLGVEGFQAGVQIGGARRDDLVEGAQHGFQCRGVAARLPTAAAHVAGRVAVRHHAHLRPRRQTDEQPADDGLRALPLRTGLLVRVRCVLAADDVDERFVGHGGAAIDQNADLAALDAEADEILLFAGLGRVDHVRGLGRVDILDLFFECGDTAALLRGGLAAGLRFLQRVRQFPRDGLKPPVRGAAPVGRGPNVVAECALTLREAAQVGLESRSLGCGGLHVVLDEQEHQDDRAQPARHDVQEGDVEAGGRTPGFQMRPLSPLPGPSSCGGEGTPGSSPSPLVGEGWGEGAPRLTEPMRFSRNASQ